MLRSVSTVATLLLALVSAASAGEWRRYKNVRFGVSAEVPAGWKELPPPENGDGQMFESPDGKARITVSGIFGTSPVAEEIALRAKPDAGETVSYKAPGAASLVVSGTKGDMIFYRRSVASCGDEIWNDLAIEYPAAQKAAYDAIVRHVSASLRGGPNASVKRCR